MKSEQLAKLVIELNQILMKEKDEVIYKKLSNSYVLLKQSYDLVLTKERKEKLKSIENNRLKVQEKKLKVIASRINTSRKRVAPSERKKS